MTQEAAAEDLLAFFKALSDANRLRIVSLLAREPRSVETLARMLGVSSSTVSHHLARLSKVGLVSARAEGYYSVYRLEPQALSQVAERILSKEVFRVQSKEEEAIPRRAAKGAAQVVSKSLRSSERHVNDLFSGFSED